MKQALITVFISLSLALAALASPAKSPMDAVKELDQMADQYRIGKNLTAKEKVFNRRLKQKILRGTFNLRELAKLALAKHWGERSTKEQNYFVELLTQLLEERSVFAKEQAAERDEAKSYQIDYKRQKFLNGIGTEALVHTVVRLIKHRTALDIDYKLLKMPGDKWRVYDVIVDDASLVANYRSSFGNIIKKHGYAELVRRMQKKLAEFRTKKSSTT